MNARSPLMIDGAVPTETPLPHTWNVCVGAGRANEALRADWQAHFAEAVDRLGMRSVRFHGLFHDDMFVYRATAGSGFEVAHELAQPIHTFSYVDKVFDAILALGARPVVELGFMPRDLATQTETLFWWGAHASPPKDMGRWVDLVSATVRHWIERYGADEVRQWRFEVWNEPNLVPLFWTGTRTQYFELYEATAHAIKAIDPALLVGGPSTSVFVPDDRYVGETEDRAVQVAVTEAKDVDALDWRPVWIEEFIDWCATRDVPLDFLTTHLYPTDYAFGSNGQGRMISRYADATRDDLLRMQEIIAASPFPTAELHITEWSTTPSSRDAVHDTVYAATYVTRAYLQCASLADSISYWAFTDVFEEGGAGVGPFHGGFGIVNEQGIHKPMFHAFAALAALGDLLLLSTDHGVVTRHESTGKVAAVFFNYPQDMNGASVGTRDTYAQTRDLAAMGPSRRVRHEARGLTPGAVFRVTVLDLEHGNVVEEWDRLGAPLNLMREQTEHLRSVADALATSTLTADGDGVLTIDVELAPWAVMSLVEA